MRRLAFVALVALAFPASALGHASVSTTSPGYRERVESSPPLVVLHFDQVVQSFAGSIEVRAANGRLVSGAARSASDRRDVVAPIPDLPRDAYTVRWYAASSDGHIISGVFTFGVRLDAPPPTEAVGASGPSTAEHVVRWGYFVSLALLIGGLGFRLLCLPSTIPAATERRFRQLTGLGVVATLEVGIVAFLLRAEGALQLPFGRLLYGDLSPMANGTRFGQAFIAMTLGFALVAAFLFLSWLADRRRLLWPALLVALGFASGLSLSGHQGTDRGATWHSQLADWVHLSAASLWVGGLVALAVAVWPTAPGLRRAAFLRFSRLATLLVALLVGAGVYLSILRLPRLQDLWTTDYGRVLLVKLGVVVAALAWGAAHRFVVKPALERASGEGALSTLRRSLVGESVVGMSVLLVAAVLVDSKPPVQPQPGSRSAIAARTFPATSGSSRAIALKSRPCITTSRIGDVAVTEAVRRSVSSSAISPKKSPGPRSATCAPSRVTSAAPASITKNS